MRRIRAGHSGIGSIGDIVVAAQQRGAQDMHTVSFMKSKWLNPDDICQALVHECIVLRLARAQGPYLP